MSTPRITLVVAAVIRRGDILLICQRSSTGMYPNLWEFPGGKVDFGESPEDALIRECKEEFVLLNKFTLDPLIIPLFLCFFVFNNYFLQILCI